MTRNPIRLSDSRYSGLSCYTANLAFYLDRSGWNADQLIAQSVRLAVHENHAERYLSFSHHTVPLDSLPDGTALHYSNDLSEAGALARMTEEVERFGNVLAVVDTQRLAWQVRTTSNASEPHWVTLYREGRAWTLVDQYVPDGESGRQYEAHVNVDASVLGSIVRLPEVWSSAWLRRNNLAFGFPLEYPTGAPYVWFRRESAADNERTLGKGWKLGDMESLPAVAEWLSRLPTDSALLKDVWAAASHRVFSYKWRLGRGRYSKVQSGAIADAIDAWEGLPRMTRLEKLSYERRGTLRGLAWKAVERILAAERVLDEFGVARHN